MLIYLLFDSLLSTCPKKMEPEKWPKAADFCLLPEAVCEKIFSRIKNRGKVGFCIVYKIE